MLRYILFLFLLMVVLPAMAEESMDSSKASVSVKIVPPENPGTGAVSEETPKLEYFNTYSDYRVGVDDILVINVLQPEEILNEVVVTPDGAISFPYIGNITVRDMTINQIQQEIQQRLADGYLKYPSVVVSLKESRSRKFFVYGEVNKPGAYFMEENATVLRAVSMAGGFTRFGSASRVKVLRPKHLKAGYDSIPVKINAVMSGNSDEDLILKSGDIVVVSEGIL